MNKCSFGRGATQVAIGFFAFHLSRLSNICFFVDVVVVSLVWEAVGDEERDTPVHRSGV